MSRLRINEQYEEPAANLANAPRRNHLDADEEEWKYFLTTIRPSAARRLTCIGVVYILIGLLNIGSELAIYFATDIK